MKINTELERVLLGEQAKPQKKAAASDDSNIFGSLLDDELAVSKDVQTKTNSSENVTHSTALADPFALSANGMIGTVAASTAAAEQDIVQSLVSGINGAIDGMNAYSQSVQNPASHKQAWSSLSAMNQSIGAMQKDFGKLSSQNPSLGSMLNDLEVMGVTETYKFNRGDYS